MKTIHRVKRKNHYTPIPNGLLRDRRLSFQARAIAAMMLTMPENWVTYTDVILDFGKEGRGKDGELSVRKAIKELEEVGYLKREKVRGERGTFEALTWNWQDEPESGFPRSGFPGRGDPHTKKEQQKKESQSVGENSGWKQKKEKGSFVPKHTRLFLNSLPKYPTTEDELVDLLETYGLDYNPDYDGGFWEEFHARNWRMPNGDPVADVAKLYEARLEKTEPKPI